MYNMSKWAKEKHGAGEQRALQGDLMYGRAGERARGAISRSSGAAVDGGELESAGAAHDLPAAESPVSAVGLALPPAGGGAGPEIVRRAFVPAASAGPFWLALPWRRGRFPREK